MPNRRKPAETASVAFVRRCIGIPFPDSKIHEANVVPTWGRQDPDGPHVGHMNFAIWELIGLDNDLSHVWSTAIT